eukprot:m.157462 g.157462  ORF g.157462 m.157462 type:complete len:511 (-) comp31057_c0_seq1:184-1716(-)
METTTAWKLPAIALALILSVPVVESALLGGSLFQNTPLPYLGLYSISVAWAVRRIHLARQTPLPIPWLWSEDSPEGGRDPLWRDCWKTVITICQLCVLPWQLPVLVATLIWQFLLYFAGFGGGAPYGGDTGGGIPVETPAKLAFVREFHEKVRKLSEKVAPHLLNDVRNAPLLPWIFGIAIYVPVLYTVFLKMHLSREDGSFSFLLCYVYHILRMGPFFKNFAHASTLIHKEGHVNKGGKGFFKGPFAFVLNHVCEWEIAFFYGHIPESYRVGHVEVHHMFGNEHDDVTSTLYLDRSKPSSFFRYLGDFWEYWTGISTLVHFFRKKASGKYEPNKDERFIFLQLSGMIAFVGTFVLHAYLVSPTFAFMYQMVPLFETINYLAAINYIWHTFIDPDDIGNEYIKSITIINGHYAVMNEDYHVEHHLRPGVHWSTVQNEFLKRKDEYRKNKASLFTETQEFELFTFVLFGLHDELAKRFVDLEGKMTHEEKKTEILRRMQAVPRTALDNKSK